MTKQEHIESILLGPNGHYYDLKDEDGYEYTLTFTSPVTGYKTFMRCKEEPKGYNGTPAIRLLWETKEEWLGDL